jgi:polyisoprenoid-binding protein YceI
MQRRRSILIAAFAASVLCVSVLGHAAKSKPAEARVTFHAAGPAGMKIDGTTNDLDLDDDANGNVVITVGLKGLTTGIDIRDRHMKEKYLEVDKYPNATLTVAKSAVKLPPSGGKAVTDVPGTLSLHGQTKSVSVHCELKNGSPVGVDGKIHLNMNDFGITIPVYLGVTVKPDVDVDVHFLAAGS